MVKKQTTPPERERRWKWGAKWSGAEGSYVTQPRRVQVETFNSILLKEKKSLSGLQEGQSGAKKNINNGSRASQNENIGTTRSGEGKRTRETLIERGRLFNSPHGRDLDKGGLRKKSGQSGKHEIRGGPKNDFAFCLLWKKTLRGGDDEYR